MSTDPIVPDALSTRGPAGVSGPEPSSNTSRPAAHDGPSFRALLDRLQDRAADLQAASQGVQGAGDLSGAVDEARASLEDALSLGDRLMEAYRASLHQEPAEDSATSTEGGAS